jgi:hypothetical protein
VTFWHGLNSTKHLGIRPLLIDFLTITPLQKHRHHYLTVTYYFGTITFWWLQEYNFEGILSPVVDALPVRYKTWNSTLLRNIEWIENCKTPGHKTPTYRQLSNYPAPKALSSLLHGYVPQWNHYLIVVATFEGILSPAVDASYALPVRLRVRYNLE